MEALKRKIYAYRFFDDLILIYPLYAVLFSDRGLSSTQIASLFIAWSLTGLLFEIPTGVLADRFSRRKLLTLAHVIQAAGFLMWLVVPSYYGFLAGFILWGISGALCSGTFEALLFDEMKAAGKDQEYVRVLGTAESLALVGVLVAEALASAAILLGYNFVLAVSVVMPFITGAIALTLPEAKKQESLGEEESEYFASIKSGVKEALARPTILKIILFITFVEVIYGALEEYFPLFAASIQLPKFAIPLVALGASLAAALASYLAHRYRRAGRAGVFLLLAISGACLILAASALGIVAAVMLALFVFVIRLLTVVFQGRLQHAIADKTRATITSVSSFVTELASIGFYAVYGLIAQKGGNLLAFKAVGLVVLGVALLSLLVGTGQLFRRKRERHEPNSSLT